MRTSFPCPIDEHPCNDAKCSRSYCIQRELDTNRERQIAENEARIEEIMDIFGIDRATANDLVLDAFYGRRSRHLPSKT